jgi:hypothetical protein
VAPAETEETQDTSPPSMILPNCKEHGIDLAST